jgi:hypothetical protein
VKTALTLICAVLLTAAAPASARIVVLDPASGAVVATPVVSDDTTLRGWVGDGTALLGERDGRVVRIDVASRAITPLPALDNAWAIGPGGRTVVVDDLFGRLRITVRGPGGRALGAQVLDAYSLSMSGAWSADGARFAFAVASSLLVFDTSTGQLVARATVPRVSVHPQAFAPDDSALLVGSAARVVRVDLPSGVQSEVVRSRHAHDRPEAAWGASGSVAVSLDDNTRLRLLGPAPAEVRPPHGFVDGMRWSPDGGALSFEVIARPRLRCGSPRYGLSLLVPGAAPRPLLPLSGAEPSTAIWSPDGRRLAVKLEADSAADLERRGKRHPWPRHIRRDYEMFSRRGDAAIRRIVVRAARALRRGASREAAMRLVSIGYERVAKRYSEAEDSAVGEALAVELSKWLRAAGFEEIDGLDELEC